MGKNINFTDDEWQCIYGCVFREYKRATNKYILDDKGHKKYLDDNAHRVWQNLLLKILCHIDCDKLDKQL